MRLKRALSINDLIVKQYNSITLQEPFAGLIGKEPEANGVWIVWGESGNGKTTFCLQLAKELAAHGGVQYDSREERHRKSLREAILNAGLQEVGRKIIFTDGEGYDALCERLARRRSPRFIFIDSVQHLALTKTQYKALKTRFPDKLFVLISHAEGRLPEGRVARFIRYDADVKIRVEGYRAAGISRHKGNKPMVIWQEGADRYWGDTTPTQPTQ